MKRIFWLASYPKSGNTWLRLFLNNLLHDNEEPVDINDMPLSNTIASAREPLDQMISLESGELFAHEIDQLRPAMYEAWSNNSTCKLYCKCHDAYTWNSNGEPLLSSRATRGALYLVRNPLDVVVSYAHHNNCNIDKAIRQMANTHHGLANSHTGQYKQLRQRLLSWSGHVHSWQNAVRIPVHTMRYEDMQLDTINTFTKATRFLQLDNNQADIEQALEACRFDKLREQEVRSKRFRETPAGAKAFFRKGLVGSWRESLTDNQVCSIIDTHGSVMYLLGYLDSQGNPVY